MIDEILRRRATRDLYSTNYNQFVRFALYGNQITNFRYNLFTFDEYIYRDYKFYSHDNINNGTVIVDNKPFPEVKEKTSQFSLKI